MVNINKVENFNNKVNIGKVKIEKVSESSTMVEGQRVKKGYFSEIINIVLQKGFWKFSALIPTIWIIL